MYTQVRVTLGSFSGVLMAADICSGRSVCSNGAGHQDTHKRVTFGRVLGRFRGHSMEGGDDLDSRGNHGSNC